VGTFVLAVVGTVIAFIIIFGCAAIPLHSGDAVIQPEGEPDPGKHTAGLFREGAEPKG
jgi:hypothetical protein